MISMRYSKALTTQLSESNQGYKIQKHIFEDLKDSKNDAIVST